jgi:hypothetical protein
MSDYNVVMYASWPFFQLPTDVEFLWSSFQFAHGLYCVFLLLFRRNKQKGLYFTYFIICSLGDSTQVPISSAKK